MHKVFVDRLGRGIAGQGVWKYNVSVHFALVVEVIY